MSRPSILGDELRQGVEPGLGLAPVVVRSPVADELLELRELHALDRSSTVSRSGQRVAAMRRRRSTSSSSGTLTRNGRMASPASAAAT